MHHYHGAPAPAEHSVFADLLWLNVLPCRSDAKVYSTVFQYIVTETWVWLQLPKLHKQHIWYFEPERAGEGFSY